IAFPAWGPGEGPIPDHPIQPITRTRRRDEVTVALHRAAHAPAHEPRPELPHRVHLLRRRILPRSEHERHAVPRGITAGLGSLGPVQPTPLKDHTVGARAEAVADVHPATRFHVEPAGALPIRHTIRMRPTRQPLISTVIVDHQTLTRPGHRRTRRTPPKPRPPDQPHPYTPPITR